VLLPLSQPSIEARDGVEPSIDSGFAGRHPPGENRARVPQEGVEPSRPETHGSEPCAAAITPPGHGVDDGDRTRGLLLGKQMRYQLRHVHMEPARRIELRLPPYRGGVLPFSLNRHGCNRGQGLAGCRLPNSATRAAVRCCPGSPALQEPGRGCAAAAMYPRRDSNAHCLAPHASASCHWATRAQSRHPVPTRVTRCTRAGPQPCAAAKLPAVDSNHDHPRPERGVLPVRPTGIGTGGAIRTRTAQDLSLLSAAIGLRPRAPPEARTPFPAVRAQCITRHACGAESG
jgi:hypothetical protein